MGRYYGGDIAGKFWFGVQSSCDAEHFGVEPSEQELVYSVCMEACPCGIQEGDVCPHCDAEEECSAYFRNEVEFHFDADHIVQVEKVLRELEHDLLKETPRFAEFVQKLNEDREWMGEDYKDDAWIDHDVYSVYDTVAKTVKDDGNLNLLAARYMLGTQILRCLRRKGSCVFWCEL